MAPFRCIEKMEDSCKQFFGKKPKQQVQSPLEKNDHPELDTIRFLNPTDTERYKSLLGAIYNGQYP